VAIEGAVDSFLAGHRLVVVEGIRLEQGSYVVEGTELVGSHPLSPRFKTIIAENPRRLGLEDSGSVHLLETSAPRFHRISPWLMLGVCPECRLERVLITDGGRQYIDVFIGHRVEIDA
jgi:hypothetical protein